MTVRMAFEICVVNIVPEGWVGRLILDSGMREDEGRCCGDYKVRKILNVLPLQRVRLALPPRRSPTYHSHLDPSDELELDLQLNNFILFFLRTPLNVPNYSCNSPTGFLVPCGCGDVSQRTTIRQGVMVRRGSGQKSCRLESRLPCPLRPSSCCIAGEVTGSRVVSSLYRW